MVTEEDTLPFDIRMVTPGTPEYEEMRAEFAAHQRNSAYYDDHAEELWARYPGPCTIVIVNNGEARSFVEDDELDAFLGSLSAFERASSFQIDHQDPNVIVIPTSFVVP